MYKKKELYKNERSFGYIFGIVFFLIGLYFYLFLAQIKAIFLVLAFSFFFISFINPKLFYYPNKIWMKFGYYLGLITTPIIISLIYILVVAPTGLILKVLRKDVLDRKINFEESTNWKKREVKNTQLDKQY